jgi:hypothetical protein
MPSYVREVTFYKYLRCWAEYQRNLERARKHMEGCKNWFELYLIVNFFLIALIINNLAHLCKFIIQSSKLVVLFIKPILPSKTNLNHHNDKIYP